MQIVFLIISLILLFIFGAGAVWFAFLKSPGETITFDKYFAVVTALLSMIFSGIGVAIQLVAIRAKDNTRGRKLTRAKRIPAILEKTLGPVPYSTKSAVFGGFYGGLFGGGMAGLINGVHYYFLSQNYYGFEAATWDIILKIFGYVLVVGAILGVLTQSFILWFRSLAVEKQFPGFVFNEVWGGIIGGLLGGILIGGAPGVFFSDRNTPPPDLAPIFWGGLLCAICIVIGAILYERKVRSQNLMLAFVTSALVAFLVYVLGKYTFAKLGFDEKYFLTEETGIKVGVEQGAKLGILIGFLWGLQIGLTLFVYRLVSPLLQNRTHPSEN